MSSVLAQHQRLALARCGVCARGRRVGRGQAGEVSLEPVCVGVQGRGALGQDGVVGRGLGTGLGLCRAARSDVVLLCE